MGEPDDSGRVISVSLFMELLMDILRVDDNADDLGFFGIAVEWTGLNICLHTALDGQQAIEYLEGRGACTDRSTCPLPHVIVLDLEMPGSSGFEFLAWRRTSRRFAALPVLVFTDSTDQEVIDRAYAMGADKCVVKPADIQDWTAVVREIWALGAHSRGH